MTSAHDWQAAAEAGPRTGSAADFAHQQEYLRQAREAGYEPAPGGWNASMGRLLAGCLMIISGIFGFLDGLAMATKGGFYTYKASYEYHWSTAAWGWTELVLGALILAAGVCLLLNIPWARVAGLVLAALSAVAAFLIVPLYPIFGVILIAVDLFIIWALVVSGRAERA
jgi:hypothetical protein